MTTTAPVPAASGTSRLFLSRLTSPMMADACVRLDVPLGLGAPGLRPLSPGMKAWGPALPVRHFGSVDVFLEAFQNAKGGEFLIIDNEGRLDEGCIGDLTVLEATTAKIAAIAVWGAVRDSVELREIGLPVYSLGTFSAGPRRIDPRSKETFESARMGTSLIKPDDFVFADDDGLVAFPAKDMRRVMDAAEAIRNSERKQVELVKSGTTLRQQFRFDAYLKAREKDPSYTLRKHLKSARAAIEE